jgi:mono/diheme cytochrome c family protein
MRNQVVSFIIFATAAATPVAAQHSIDFQRDIQPIFNDNCIACHRGAGAPAGLQLDSAAGVLKGSTARSVIVPGDAQKSILAQRVSDTTGNQMPPGGPLSKEQIAFIVEWINQGAKVPAGPVPVTQAAPAPAKARPALPNIATVTTAAQERAMLDYYCVVCHQGTAAPKGLKIDQLDPADVERNAATWEKIVHKVRTGMMPPSGFPRPERSTFESMIVYLENELDKHAVVNLPPPGLHRLNRTEYQNAIRDLLALPIDASRYLPSDDSTRGFDNVAAGLSLSPALIEGYTAAASKISRLAIGDVKEPTEWVYRAPEDTSQDYHIEGMPFGTRGGLIASHEFPADGDYIFKVYPINKGNMDNNQAFGEIRGEKLELLVDGERVKLYDWDTEIGRGAPVHAGSKDVKFSVKAGVHTVAVTFLATNYAPGNDLDQHFLRSTIETGGLPGHTFFPHVGKLTIQGPENPKGASDTASRRAIFICHPANPSQEQTCARQIVSNLARRAFRRPVTPNDTETLMSFYQQGRNEGGNFEHGIEMALRRILADPEFVFRKEAEPPTLKPGEKYRITDVELASRLSFFLWSSIPDDELLNLATQNKLHEPAVLEQQVKRMLADKKSDQLVLNFAGQWLNLRAIPTLSPVTSIFPDFDDNLRQAMRRETELFVDSIVHEDRPVTDLLDGNYTFLNERLAKHYGIPGIYGSDFRRVELPPEFDVRRGLLGKASFLTTSAQPNRTSPVGRGKTVMETFLGAEPPEMPAGVIIKLVATESTHGAAPPSMRQQMEMHRAVEPCASCHKIMDPIGFALENFDAIGQWRDMDGRDPVDAKGMLVDGTQMDGVKGLRNALVNYKSEFVRVLADKLMIYALGRGTEYYDMPLMRSIVREAEKHNYRFSWFVLGIVKSEPFQMNMKLQLSANPAEGAQRAAR